MGMVEEDNITVEIIGWIVLFLSYIFVYVYSGPSFHLSRLLLS
jgi:hypothetical protein